MSWEEKREKLRSVRSSNTKNRVHKATTGTREYLKAMRQAREDELNSEYAAQVEELLSVMKPAQPLMTALNGEFAKIFEDDAVSVVLTSLCCGWNWESWYTSDRAEWTPKQRACFRRVLQDVWSTWVLPVFRFTTEDDLKPIIEAMGVD